MRSGVDKVDVLVWTKSREASGGDTKHVQEAAYEGETEIDEVVGKFIKRRKS